jgi:hypothetical protein
VSYSCPETPVPGSRGSLSFAGIKVTKASSKKLVPNFMHLCAGISDLSTMTTTVHRVQVECSRLAEMRHLNSASIAERE